jgi:hypothetical protein
MDSLVFVQPPYLFWSRKYFEKRYSNLRLEKDTLIFRTINKSVYMFQSESYSSPITSIGRQDDTAAVYMRRYNNYPLNRLKGGIWDAV